MHIGLHLGTVNPRIWVPLAEAADHLGYESVWVPEHLVVPLAASGSPHAGAAHPPIPSRTPMFDAFAVLSHFAARTTRLRLGTNVFNVGLRHPIVSARAAATADVLSGGRIAVGVGASWLREEWDALGLDFDTRGRRVDEALAVCRRLWTEDVVEHHGEFFDFGRTAFEPKPVQQPLPLHVGGDGPAARRRAATLGTGWMPMNHALDALPAAIADLRERADRAGRDTPVEVTVNAAVSSTADVAPYAAAGVTRLIVRPWQRTRDALASTEEFAARVLTPLAAG